MSDKRFGARLSQVVPLSGLDIEEILSEQGSTGKRFGDIAIELGLCTPEHVWRAWSSQLAESPQRINLDSFAIDAQAASQLPAAFAMRYHIIPLRVLGDELVIAIDEAAYPEGAREIMAILRRPVQFVLASHPQIARALRRYYVKSEAA
jgi:type IV pilus assembly protein PilB